tara:strand:- start:2156 stop:2425 length:270 start_codon:yes stop_codon:yes gene_type:complete
MIIPMKCYTCGKNMADKWVPYITAVQNDKNSFTGVVDESDKLELKYIDVSKPDKPEKSIEGKILDEMNLHRYCCRRMMLGNVHIISSLS